MKKRLVHTELVPVRRELLSSAEFIRIAKERPDSIARSRFVAPTIGKRDFGHFEVEYSTPVLKRIAHA